MKKYLKIAVVIISVLGLAACQKQENTTSQEKMQEINNDINNSDMYSGDNLYLVTPLGDLWSSPYTVTENGCYELYQNEDGSRNILYTDFSTQQRNYLSNSISGIRQREGDISYFSEPNSGVSLCEDEKYLFIFKYGVDGNVETAEEASPGCIYRADLDGKNRVLLTVFDKEYELPNSKVVSDGTYLYALADSKISSACALIRINIDNGNVEIVKKLEYDICFIQAACDDKIILKILNIPEMTDEDSYWQQEHIILSLSLTDLSVNEIMRWKQDKVAEIHDGAIMYYLSQDEIGKIMSVDCRTGEKKVVADISEIKNIDWELLNSFIVLQKVIDNWIEIECYSELMEPAYVYAVRLTDGKINALFDASQSEDSESRIPFIIGEWEDSYLVMADILSIPRQIYAPDGSPYMGEYQMNELAFIKKDDYWQGNFEMEKVEDTFLEQIKVDTLYDRSVKKGICDRSKA